MQRRPEQREKSGRGLHQTGLATGAIQPRVGTGRLFLGSGVYCGHRSLPPLRPSLSIAE